MPAIVMALRIGVVLMNLVIYVILVHSLKLLTSKMYRIIVLLRLLITRDEE